MLYAWRTKEKKARGRREGELARIFARLVRGGACVPVSFTLLAGGVARTSILFCSQVGYRYKDSTGGCVAAGVVKLGTRGRSGVSELASL